jgi:histidinol-phosphate/aromatic aminotransferase/cobyric acid decarboxylase-like protein
MSPSPFAVSSPTDPASYSWEATDEGVAARFGIPIEQVLRFDLNTSPAPPALLAGLSPRPVRHDALRVPAGRLPQPSRRPPTPGVATDELVPGRADEILDMCTKASCPRARPRSSRPTYLMYRIHAEQRGARAVAVPRLGRGAG